MAQKIKWNSVTNKLPKHHELVLAVSRRGTCAVVIFVDNEQIFQGLMMRNIQVPHEQREGYSFCSQELPGNVFENVTHWAYIPKVDL